MAKSSVLKSYLNAYRKLVASERVADKTAAGESVAISIPLHFSGNHRVEVTVTEFSSGRYILSDMARTLSELCEGGKPITADFRKRVEEIAAKFGARFVLDHLILDCDTRTLGESIQRLAEACKTIGDAYLLQQPHAPAHLRAVVDEVKRIFSERQIDFRQDFKVKGEVEQHEFDIYVPPNGRPGMAVRVIAGHNTHALAKIWAFNCWDVRNANKNLKLGLVLDEEDSAPWTSGSRRILRKTADVVAPSSDLDALEHGLMLQGVG